MTPQVELMEVVTSFLEANCSIPSISLKELPAEGGLYAELGVGSLEDKYMDKSTTKNYPILFLNRNRDQKECLEQLASICNFIEKQKSYPNGETFSWLDASVASEPAKIGRDEDGVYHYSCLITCKIFY